MRSSVRSEIWNPDAVSVEGLDLAASSKPLVSDAAFTISRGDRIAVLGRNGCGKSTLFHWLSETRGPRAWSVYEVAQELAPSAASVVRTVLAAHIERGRLWARLQELEGTDQYQEYRTVADELAAQHADADEPRVRKILHGLGFSVAEMDGPLSNLSGGWRARVALAQGLFMEPDLLLLDEPTNHLDLAGVIWLTRYLQGWRRTLLVISHNVGFVREVATAQWLLAEGRLSVYRCSFGRYLKAREEEARKRVKAWEALEKEVAALRSKGTPVAKKQAEELMTKKEKEGIRRPEKPYSPKFFFLDTAKTTTEAVLLRVRGSLGYGEGPSVLTDVDFALHPRSRVALVGSNGAGKSTLMKAMTGDEGVLAELEMRPGLRVIRFDQHFYHSLPEDQTPLDYLRGTGADVDVCRRILGASGLEGAAHTRPLGTLSGGQKARVYFAAIACRQPDVLLMDEPTNHLDMETIAALIAGLHSFPGAAVVVSHDLDFLEEIATEVWITRDGTLIRLSEGSDGLADYVDSLDI